MFEPESLNSIGELDVDRKVIRVEFQLVVLAQSSDGIDVHIEVRHPVIESEPPVPVSIGVSLKIDHWGSVGLAARRIIGVGSIRALHR